MQYGCYDMRFRKKSSVLANGVFAIADTVLYLVIPAVFAVAVTCSANENSANFTSDENAPAQTNRTLLALDYERGFVLTRVRYNLTNDFSITQNGVVNNQWRNFGASEDWFYLNVSNILFNISGLTFETLRVASNGIIEPIIRSDETTPFLNPIFCPFTSLLGIVPEFQWDSLPSQNLPSLFWYDNSRYDSVLLTWQNVLINREAQKPFSFQAEIFSDGKFVYRYDFSKLNEQSISSFSLGAKFMSVPWQTNLFTRSTVEMEFYPLYDADKTNNDYDNDGLRTIDELFLYHTDPHRADMDNDGLEDGDEIHVYNTNPANPFSLDPNYIDSFSIKLEGANPFSFPNNSTNQLWEHIFYSGTKDGSFYYPATNAEYAVMKVAVSGAGAGILRIDDMIVPLFAKQTTPDITPLSNQLISALSQYPNVNYALTSSNVMPNGSETNVLLLAIGRGKKKRLWWSKPDGLDVAIKSDDFLIGELPTKLNPFGWIAFPHIEATPVCIHNQIIENVQVTLVHGEQFPGLSAKWESEDKSVSVQNKPPVSAYIGGKFKKNEKRSITYTLSHPLQLNKTSPTFVQTVRYCPPFYDDQGGYSGSMYYSYQGLSTCNCSWYDDEMCDHGKWCYCGKNPCRCNAIFNADLNVDDIEEEMSFKYITTYFVNKYEDVLYLYRSNEDRQRLFVPNESHEQCCPCPSHNYSNSVGCVVYSDYVMALDEDGKEFEKSDRDTVVKVQGVYPSYHFNDARVLFMTNSGVYIKKDYTVLGVDIITDHLRGTKWYKQVSPTLGIVRDVCNDVEKAITVGLVASVNLDDGYFRLAIEDLEGDVELWIPSRMGDYEMLPAQKLLDSQRPERYFKLSKLKAIFERYGSGDHINLAVLSSSPGSFTLVFEYAHEKDGAYIHDYARQKVTIVDKILKVDYNRNGKIDAHDNERSRRNDEVYFWCNKSTWKDDDGFSIQYSENSSNGKVDGRHDLLNFIPISIDLSAFAKDWQHQDLIYQISCSSKNMHCALVDADMNNLKAIHLGDSYDIKKTPIYKASLESLDYYENLPNEFLELAYNKRGAIILEFEEPRETCWFSIYVYTKDYDLLYMTEVPLHIGELKNMMGWLNIREAAGGTGGVPTNLTCSDWPESEHKKGNVIFVHGYNMEEDIETEQWSKDVFKKLWWSGLDYGFIAVQWRGNEGQLAGTATPNYYSNVKNAFVSAQPLAERMNAIAGPKWFLAHSLGNMLVSAAIQDFGMEHKKYFMLNAAVALEAYDPEKGITDESRKKMTPSDWADYPQRVRSTHWYKLFNNDGRSLLTWKGRFSNVTNIVNFYSTEEEVLANGDGEYHQSIRRKYAWYNQEIKKGSWLFMMHEHEGGWGFNTEYDTIYKIFYNIDYLNYNGKMPPERTDDITDDMLRAQPFFLPFVNKQIFSDDNGKTVSTNYAYRAELLAYAIPAESYAVGANPLNKFSMPDGVDDLKSLFQNYDMATYFRSGRSEMGSNSTWVHSTFTQRPFKRVHELYSTINKHIELEK